MTTTDWRTNKGGVDPDKDRDERAREAVKQFRAMQPMLSKFAQMLTKRKDVRVELTAGTPATDGTIIKFRPPMALGDRTPHSARLCDKRDENKQLLCKACSLREDVMCDIIHEVSHIVFGTFAKPDPADIAAILDRAIDEVGTKYSKKLREKINTAPTALKRDYLNMSQLISPFLPNIINALDDARIDTAMFSARRGTKVMFEANFVKVMTGQTDFADWKLQPLNAQIVVGLFIKASGYEYHGYLHPKVEKALDDPELTGILARLKTVVSMKGVYHLAFPVLARLRELGFCRAEEDPDNESDPQNEESGDGISPSEAGESDTGSGDSTQDSSDGGSRSSESEDNGSGDGVDRDDSGEGQSDSGGSPDMAVDEDLHGDSDGGTEPEDDNGSDANGDLGGSDGLDDTSARDAGADGGMDQRTGTDEQGSDSGSDDSGAGESGGDEASPEQGDGVDGDAEASTGDPSADGADADSGDDGNTESNGSSGQGDETDMAGGDSDDGAGSDNGPGDDVAESSGDTSGDDSDESNAPSDSSGDADGASDGSSSGPSNNEEEVDGDSRDGSHGDSGGSSGSSGGDTRGDEAVSDPTQDGSGGGFADGDATDYDSDATPDRQDGTGASGAGDSERTDGSDDGDVADERPSDTAGTGDIDGPRSNGNNSGMEQSGNPSDVPDHSDASQHDSSNARQGQDGELGGAPEANSSDVSHGDGARTQEPGEAQSADRTDSADEDEGSSELIDNTNKNAGQLNYDPRLDDVPYGTAQDVKDSMIHVHERDEPTGDYQEAEDLDAIDKAIVQGAYFETGSRNIFGVREHRFGHPIMDGDQNMSMAWNSVKEYGILGYGRRSVGIDVDLDVPESILGPALLRMRVAFDNNKRGDKKRNKKSGAVDARVLGKRAWKTNDDRLFSKNIKPGKRDYAVLIGIDCSGSTVGVNIALAKRAAMAQANLCQRLGVKFAVYAHTSMPHSIQYGGRSELDLDIFIIKEFDSPWNDTTQRALRELGPASGNLDGHTIEYYRKVLERQKATDKILMYYTDGAMPASNYNEELEVLQREIDTFKRKNITLMGVGIHTDSPKQHGLDTVQVSGDSDIVLVVQHLEKRLAAR